MDILIRNIDVVALNNIDEQAKKKGISRNELLKRHIEKLAYMDVFIKERNRFEDVWEKNTLFLEHHVHIQNKLYEKIERLETIVFLLANNRGDNFEEYLDRFDKDGEFYGG